MWIRLRERPTGRRLFRVCLWASVAAAVVGGVALLACWAATGYDPQAGRDFAYLAELDGVVLTVAVVLHYPWSPRWVECNLGRPDDEPSPTPAQSPSRGNHP